MEVLRKLKCALASKQTLESYYQDLSKKELKKRKTHHFNIFIATVFVWGFAFALTIFSAKMDPPLMILYSGTVSATIAAMWVDYRKKVKLIDELLKAK